jgi:polysaccharide biosynthesis/export protein
MTASCRSRITGKILIMSKLNFLPHALLVCLAVGAAPVNGAQAPATQKPNTQKPATQPPARGVPPPAAQAPAPAPNPQTPALPTAPTPTVPAAKPGAQPPAAPTPKPGAAVVAEVPMAPDYVIGTGDILAVVFWRQPDMSAEVVVRPDGRISIPLLNEVEVKGLTPEQLRVKLTNEAQKFVQDPNVTVVVKQIHSRIVYITGQVARPGPYALTTSMTVLQLLSSAGGLLEYADEKNITIMRNMNGKTVHYTFNYKDILNRKNLKQNIELRPDDTVIVP